MQRTSAAAERQAVGRRSPLSFSALSGSRTALPPSRPLRSARASFPACRSSLSNARLRTRFPYFQPLAVDLSMAIRVYQETVFCRVCTASRSPHDVVNVPRAEFGDVLLADRTEPLLFLPQIQQFPSALECSLHFDAEPSLKVRLPRRVEGVCCSFHLDVTGDRNPAGTKQDEILAVYFAVKDPMSAAD